MFVINIQPMSEKTTSITLKMRPVRENPCFSQKQGYPYKMAEKSAILKLIKMKLGTSIDNMYVIVNIKFEPIPSINEFFMILFVFFRKQNGRHSRHLGSDFHQKQ